MFPNYYVYYASIFQVIAKNQVFDKIFLPLKKKHVHIYSDTHYIVTHTI